MSSNQVCQFYQRGNCRFGNNCRNRHLDQQGRDVRRQQSTRNGGENRFSELNNQNNNNTNNGSRNVFNRLAGTKAGNEQQLGFTTDSIVEDMKLQGIWPLSVYGPDKTVYPPINLISGYDYCFEEVRWECYKDRMLTGAFQNYLTQVNQLLAGVQQRKNEILQAPEKAFLWVFEQIKKDSLNSNAGRSPSGSAFRQQSQQTSAFSQPSSKADFGGVSSFSQPPATVPAFGGQAAQVSAFGQMAPTPSMPFGQAASVPSAFGSPQPQTFNQMAQAAPNAAFGQANTSAFGQANTSAFGQANTSAFGQANTSAFGQANPSAFGQPTAPPMVHTTVPSAFGQPQAAFQQPSLMTPQQLAPGASDTWMAPEFEFGKIPESEPPPQYR